jgi:uncharacterized membrane protein
MWNQTFILTDQIKTTLLPWMIAMILAATASDLFDSTTTTTLPLSIASVFAQTYIVVAALRVGVDPAAQAAIRPLFGRVFGISILTTLGIVLGGLLLIIPGVFLLVRWWIAIPVALDRDIGATEAMRESWALTAPHWASILGLFLVALALVAIPLSGLFFLGGFDDAIVSLPMSLAMNTVLYTATMVSMVSTVAAYRTIYQPTVQLRQVFE